MKKIIKIILFWCLLFWSADIFAQPGLQGYLDAESARIKKAQATEKEIEKFIKERISNYILNPGTAAEITAGALKEGVTNQREIELMLLNARRAELRGQYFKMHPEVISFYQPIETPEVLRQTCVNGDFEQGAANFAFNSAANFNTMTGCTTPAAINSPVIPTVNNVASPVTIISNVPGYPAVDPTLIALGIPIPTLSVPSGGNQSIKLNATDGGGNHVTTMTRNMLITDPFLEYEFSLILENWHAQTIDNPFFRVNIIAAGQTRTLRCITTGNAQCIFTTVQGNNGPIMYTGWRCDRLPVGDFIGQNVTIEFTMADCRQGGHFGTVYLDNVCDFTCTNPAFGYFDIPPLNNNCNTTIPGSIYQVCGTYNLAPNSTLNPNGLNIAMTTNGVNYFPVPILQLQQTGNNFCFLFDALAFGTIVNGSTYTFQITASYTQVCPPLTVSSTEEGYVTVTFNNCCPQNLTLGGIIPTLQQFERWDWIKSTSQVTYNTGLATQAVVFHGGNFVELLPGFEVVTGAKFRADPIGCNNPFVYRSANNLQNPKKGNSVAFQGNPMLQNPTPVEKQGFLENIALSNIKDVYLVPNPASSIVNIITGGTRFKKITITSVDGKHILTKRFDGKTRYQLDINGLASGIYLVHITMEDGSISSKKLIKN